MCSNHLFNSSMALKLLQPVRFQRSCWKKILKPSHSVDVFVKIQPLNTLEFPVKGCSICEELLGKSGLLDSVNRVKWELLHTSMYALDEEVSQSICDNRHKTCTIWHKIIKSHNFYFCYRTRDFFQWWLPCAAACNMGAIMGTLSSFPQHLCFCCVLTLCAQTQPQLEYVRIFAHYVMQMVKFKHGALWLASFTQPSSYYSIRPWRNTNMLD